MQRRPFIQAILAAALFGIAMPFSKTLLADIQPNQLAGLLYLGAAACLLFPWQVSPAWLGALILGGFSDEARSYSHPPTGPICTTAMTTEAWLHGSSEWEFMTG